MSKDTNSPHIAECGDAIYGILIEYQGTTHRVKADAKNASDAIVKAVEKITGAKILGSVCLR